MTGSTRILECMDTWIFDLDNTLYPARLRLFDQVSERMTLYVADYLDLEHDRARVLQKQYYLEHGTTLNGMMKLHGCDPEEFLAYVHDIDYSPIPESPELALALDRLPGRKLVFTNGDTPHARRAMERLGVADRFDAVFDIVASGYVPKPEPSVYRALIERHGIDPCRSIYFEDIARNLKPAKDLGMTTVLVEDGDAPLRDADRGHVDHRAPELAPWLADLAAAGSG